MLSDLVFTPFDIPNDRQLRGKLILDCIKRIELDSIKDLKRLINLKLSKDVELTDKDEKELLNELKDFCERTHIIISFVAGLKSNIILKYIGANSEVVRIMPNIFIETNNSATAIFTKNLNHRLKKKLKTDIRISDITQMKK